MRPVDAPTLLRQTRALEIAARRNVTSTLAGNYVTRVRGSGMEFHEARPYRPGDPERTIDWNMTARLGEPWVRVFLEEREREVVVALDVSASMHAGWQARSKLETAVEVAATIGLSAIEAGDRLGFLTFRDRVDRLHRPLGGRAQLHRMLRCLVEASHEPPVRTDSSDPRAAIHAIQALGQRRLVVFLVSDFLDHDVPEDLRFLGWRHDVTLVHVFDPFEHAGPGPVRLLAHAPEGSGEVALTGIDCGGPLGATEGWLRRAATPLGIDVHPVACTDPIGRSLASFFHRKRPWTR